MPLSEIDYAAGQDSMTDVFNKTNDAIVKVNEIDAAYGRVSSNDTNPGYLNGKLVAGDNIQFTENNDADDETLTIDVVTRDVGYATWSGTQAMTNSYVTVGSLTYTAPNDSIARYYQIIADIDSRLNQGNSTIAYDIRLYNVTDATELRVRSFAWDDLDDPGVSSLVVNPQNTITYYGQIPANKQIAIQVRYTDSSALMDVKAGSLMMTEINR